MRWVVDFVRARIGKGATPMLVAVLLAAIALAPATARPGDIIKSSQPEAKSKAVPPADLLIEQLKKMVPQISLDRYRSLLASIKTTGPIVDARKYRWQVAIRIPVANKRCGGILISKIFVLTAAHCLDRNRLSGGPPMAFDRGQVEIFHGSDVFAAGTRLALDPAWPIILYPGWRDPTVSGTDAEGAFDAALIKQQYALQAGQLNGQGSVAAAQLALLQNQAGVTLGTNTLQAQLSASELALAKAVLRNNADMQLLRQCVAEHDAAAIDICFK